MKYKKLLELATPLLEENDFGVGHTLRVLEIAKKNYEKYDIDKSWKDVAFSLVILHDIGGSEIKDQYEKGPILAKKLMKKVDYAEFDIKMICAFIARHHEHLENPHEIFKLLFDSDQLVKFSKEEFSHYDSKIDWKGVIKSFYNEDLRKTAEELLRGRNKNGKTENN